VRRLGKLTTNLEKEEERKKNREKKERKNVFRKLGSLSKKASKSLFSCISLFHFFQNFLSWFHISSLYFYL